jgi:hypothetical protein
MGEVETTVQLISWARFKLGIQCVDLKSLTYLNKVKWREVKIYSLQYPSEISVVPQV